MLLHLDQIDTNFSTNNPYIGGAVYLQIGQSYFPEENWYDIASLILEQWIPLIHSFANNSTDVCKLTFYDGPCYAVIRRNPNSAITVKCVYNQKNMIEETVIDFSLFLNSVIKAGNHFCRLLRLQGGNNEAISASLQALKNNIRTVRETGLY